MHFTEFKAGDYVGVDVECYGNYFLVGFKHRATGCKWWFEISPDSTLDIDGLRYCLFNFCTFGFNSLEYDVPIIFAALAGYQPEQLKRISNEIIALKLPIDEIKRDWGFKIPKINHIDLIEVAPLQASLKQYGARMHSQRIQELPYPHDMLLNREQAGNVKTYNGNDLDLTQDLFDELFEAITLRIAMTEEYGIDLRSKSDAQIAEAVIGSEYERICHRRPGRARLADGYIARYVTPPGLQFETAPLQALLHDATSAAYPLNGAGKPTIPKNIEGRKVPVGNALYKVGIGGLHSCEKSQAIVAKDGYIISDVDADSYYPRCITNQKLFPPHLGSAFLNIYEPIITRRLRAKALGKTDPAQKAIANSLKITINGSFGKFGQYGSILYHPDLLIQTTITGQLYLLMMAEMMELNGIQVVSGNTDGVVMYYHESKRALFESIVKEWQSRTGFTTEETQYKALYSRDVNNYIAFKEKGTKTKGKYLIPEGSARLMKNPDNRICVEAAIAAIEHGADIEATIRASQDITGFLAVRAVKGGAVDADGEPIGKTVRYYHARGKWEPLRYAKNAHRVSDSGGACELMELGAFPDDINYRWYIEETRKILTDIGFYGTPKSLSFF